MGSASSVPATPVKSPVKSPVKQTAITPTHQRTGSNRDQKVQSQAKSQPQPMKSQPPPKTSTYQYQKPSQDTRIPENQPSKQRSFPSTISGNTSIFEPKSGPPLKFDMEKFKKANTNTFSPVSPTMVESPEVSSPKRSTESLGDKKILNASDESLMDEILASV